MRSKFRTLVESWLPWILAILVLSILFVWVTNYRSGVFGRHPIPGDNLWRNNATQTLQMARFWYQEGILKTGLLMRFHINAVEAPSEGFPYLSYPPGFVILPWLVATLSSHAPDLKLVMLLGTIFQALTACLSMLTVAFLSISLGVSKWLSTIFGVLSASLAIVLPGAMIFFPFAWWADIFVIPIFLAMLLFEATSYRWEGRKWHRRVRRTLLFLGVISDWLFFLLIGALILKELTAGSRRRRNVLKDLFIFPSMYLIFHAVQIWRVGGWASFVNKLELRTGVSANLNSWKGLSDWKQAIWENLGMAGLGLYFVSLAALPVVIWFFLKRDRLEGRQRRWIEILFCALVPLHAHFILLHQHYYEHGYNVAKLAVLLPLICFGLLPALLVSRMYSRIQQTLLTSVFVAACVFWAQSTWYRNDLYLSNPLSLKLPLEAFCNSVIQSSSVDDIVFSPDFATVDSLNLNPAKLKSGDIEDWGVNACNRKVYFVSSPKNVGDLFQSNLWARRLMGKSFRLVLWTAGNPSDSWKSSLLPEKLEATGGFQAHEIPKEVLSR